MTIVTRRQLIAALGGIVTALPLAARAQQPGMPIVGFLHSATADSFPDYRLSAFRQGLNESGFPNGRKVPIEFRFADGQRSRLPGLAADLVRGGVATIVVNGVALPAAMAATSTIPIVFVGGTDPVAQRLVSSLSRPDGNVTGVSSNKPALTAKRLQLLHELISNRSAIALLLDSNGPAWETQLQDLTETARSIGREITVVRVTHEGEFDSAFKTFLGAHAGGLVVGSSAFFVSHRRKLVELAARYSLPTIYDGRLFVELGGLMSYDASTTDSYRQGGAYVGRILMGARPNDLPVRLPSSFELVFNKATVKTLGLGLPRRLQVQATFVE